MNQSINCLTVTVVSPVSILWRLTPDQPMWQEKDCVFPLFPIWAMQSVKPFWWHPILSLGALQLPVHVTSSRTITVPLILLKSTPSRLQGPLRHPYPPPAPLALKNLHHTTLTCAFLSFAESRCFGAEWKHILYNWQKTHLKSLKAALFLIFHRFCSSLSWNLWAKTANSQSVKCEGGSGTGLWHGRG